MIGVCIVIICDIGVCIVIEGDVGVCACSASACNLVFLDHNGITVQDGSHTRLQQNQRGVDG